MFSFQFNLLSKTTPKYLYVSTLSTDSPLKDKSKVMGDFWYDLKLWSEGYKCTKKSIFHRTESVATTPKSRDHMPTTSLWGVAAKWPTRALKTKLILCLRDPQGYSRISLSLPGRILKESWYSMGFSKSHSLKCSLHKWALCGAARKSDHLNCVNLIHFHLIGGRLRGSSCIVIPGVVCKLLQFAATQ